MCKSKKWSFGQPLGTYEDWFDGIVYIAFSTCKDRFRNPDPRPYVKSKSSWELIMWEECGKEILSFDFFKCFKRDKRNAKRRKRYRLNKKNKKK